MWLRKVRIDFVNLNSANTILAFEALNGNLLYVKDKKKLAEFSSLVAREYEDIMGYFDDNPEIRHRSAEVLGEIGDERAVIPLINALKDEKHSVQWRAKEALRKIGSPAVLPLIDKMDDEDPDIRRRAACALGDIRDERAISPLIENLDDNDAIVRLKTAISLSKFGEKAIQPLIEALNNDSFEVREKAALALGEIGNPIALKPLEESLSDENPYVRNGAANAIKLIKKQNLGS